MRHILTVMTALVAATFTVAFAVPALGQETSEAPAFELSCRAKAKEIAAETYRGCMSENRRAQLDQIKADYQARLKAVKDEYAQELKKLSSGGSSVSPKAAPKTVESDIIPPSASKPVKKSTVASKSALPSKKKTTARVTPMPSTETTVQVKPADDSVMDLPEPIPVESVPESENQI